MSDDDEPEKPHRFDWGLGATPQEDPEPPPLIEPPAPEPKSWELPTQLNPASASWELPPPQDPRPSWELPTQLTPRQPDDQPLPAEPAPADDGIDALFGADRFREYEDAPVLQQVPFPSRTAERERVEATPAPREQRAGVPRGLLIIAAVLVGVLVLVLVFIGGTRLDLHPTSAVAPPVSSAPSASPTPKSTVTLASGTYDWNQLAGGECLTDFQSAWQQQYTVVACNDPHTAQLVVTGTFEDAAYPGADELASRMNILCSSVKYVNYRVAGEYADIQVAGSYAQTQQQWDAGDHDYYCFMARSSGDAIEGNLSRRSRAS